MWCADSNALRAHRKISFRNINTMFSLFFGKKNHFFKGFSKWKANIALEKYQKGIHQSASPENISTGTKWTGWQSGRGLIPWRPCGGQRVGGQRDRKSLSFHRSSRDNIPFPLYLLHLPPHPTFSFLASSSPQGRGEWELSHESLWEWTVSRHSRTWYQWRRIVKRSWKKSLLAFATPDKATTAESQADLRGTATISRCSTNQERYNHMYDRATSSRPRLWWQNQCSAWELSHRLPRRHCTPQGGAVDGCPVTTDRQNALLSPTLPNLFRSPSLDSSFCFVF